MLARSVCLCAVVLGGLAKAQDAFLAQSSSDKGDANSSRSLLDWLWKDAPCDVNEILERGDAASYSVFNKFHNEYLSTDGRNVDLYHDSGDHAIWHLRHVSGNTANRFYLANDWTKGYLSSSGDYNHDNVELWGVSGGRGGRDDFASNRELQWLIFSAAEITNGAPKCTFYIMHSDSHKWLDTHGDNVHIWGDYSDIFEMGDAPENLQWELKPVL
jgi:hypothetical protein